jgi:hypothetical protein
VSSEALARALGKLRHCAKVGRPVRGGVTLYATTRLDTEDCEALLAEVARLEQEAADGSDLEHQSERRAYWRERAETAEAALAVARDREQRLREAAQGVVNAGRGYTAAGGSIWLLDVRMDALRAALVDENPMEPSGEPAAATLAEPGYAASVMWQHMCAELIRDAAPNWMRATPVGEPCSECGKTEDEARGDEPAVPGRRRTGRDAGMSVEPQSLIECSPSTVAEWLAALDARFKAEETEGWRTPANRTEREYAARQAGMAVEELRYKIVEFDAAVQRG